MKILWVSARLIGPAAAVVPSDYRGSSGGWIQSEYDSFPHCGNEIIYLCGTRGKINNNYEKIENEYGTVYLVKLPYISNGIKAPKYLIDSVTNAIADIRPDIIHLWGTETCIQDAVISSNLHIPIVVFIQGLIGIHKRYRGGYIKVLNKEYEQYLTLKQKLIRTIRDKAFFRQATIEADIIYRAGNVIVDSDFAKAYCNTVSNSVRYFTRHLTPNLTFKDKQWCFTECEKNTIFTIYGGSPDKGLHQMLKAITIVKDKIPDVKVYIPGPFHIDKGGKLLNSATSNPYERWMADFIRKNRIQENIRFVGAQSPEGMAKYINKCNVYVNPSCMEVHALSLREAMAAGAPVISSLCGSAAELVDYGINGYIYRYEEYELLAYLIIKVLSNAQMAADMGKNARMKMEQYYIKSSKESLFSIYNKILGYE